MDENFMTGSVPVAVAARVYGKDATWVRAGIISGWLPIGNATRNGKLVTNGYSYEYIKLRLEIPCCRDNYYELYRKFFWILSNTRN